MHINPILQQGWWEERKLIIKSNLKFKGDLCSIDNPFKAFACDPGV